MYPRIFHLSVLQRQNRLRETQAGADVRITAGPDQSLNEARMLLRLGILIIGTVAAVALLRSFVV